MKNFIIFFCLVFCINLCVKATSTNQVLNESKKFGLVSYLTTLKSTAEFKLASLIEDPRYKTDIVNAKSIRSQYNLLKLKVDEFVNQMNSDMISKNRLKTYKVLNNYIMKQKELPTKFNKYKGLLDQIENEATAFLNSSYPSVGVLALTPTSLEEVTGAIELGFGIIKDIRDFNEKKIGSINLILKELKLTSLKELTEPKKDTP